MSEDLQGLLDKIRTDGLNKAETEAKAILGDAESKANAILAEAEAKAKAIVEEATRKTETFTESSKRTLSQAAANLMIDVDKALLEHLNRLLGDGVSASMLDTAFVAGIVQEAVKSYLSQGAVKIAAGEKLAGALRSAFAAEAGKGVEIVLDESAGTGFRVLLADGRIEHNFTSAAIAEAIALQVRPALAELLK